MRRTQNRSGKRALQRVIGTLRKLYPSLRERYNVSFLGVFGSVARGESRPTSDVDILIDFQGTPPSLFKFIELEESLSDRLKAKVDLVMRDSLKPRIGRRILAETVSV